MQQLDQQAPQNQIAATKLTITISIVSSWNVVADQLRSFQQPLNHRRAARALDGKQPGIGCDLVFDGLSW